LSESVGGKRFICVLLLAVGLADAVQADDTQTAKPAASAAGTVPAKTTATAAATKSNAAGKPAAATKSAPAAKPAAPAADDDLLEFLGSVDSDSGDQDWIDYLSQTDIAKVAKGKKDD
jgi:hypothetical protein